MTAFGKAWGVVKNEFDRGKRYKIIRFFFSSNKSNKTIKSGLTLDEAQAHCQDPSTHVNEGTGESNPEKWWFDGYTEM